MANGVAVTTKLTTNSTARELAQQLKFKAGSASEVRLTVFLLADRDSKSDASVKLIVDTIDTDIAKHGS